MRKANRELRDERESSCHLSGPLSFIDKETDTAANL